MGDVYVLSRDGKPHSQLPANIANHPFNNVLYIVVEGKGKERETCIIILHPSAARLRSFPAMMQLLPLPNSVL
jgi:hypothetical protein